MAKSARRPPDAKTARRVAQGDTAPSTQADALQHFAAREAGNPLIPPLEHFIPMRGALSAKEGIHPCHDVWVPASARTTR